MLPRSSYAWNTLGRVELGEGDRDAGREAREILELIRAKLGEME